MDEAGDGDQPASEDEDNAGDPGAADDTETYEGLAPPADEGDQDAGAVSDEGSGVVDESAVAGPVESGGFLPTPWLGSTAPIGLPPPPPRRGLGRVGLIIAIVVLLFGAAAGVYLALSGGSSETPVARPSPTPVPSPSLLPPESLTATAEPFAVTITWTQQAGQPPVESYEIYRNNTLVDEVPGTSTTYQDSGVTPGKRYTYELKAKAGTLQTSAISVEVTTPTPAVSEARLEGDYNVKLKVVSSSGFRSISTKATAGWQFKPKCKAGPCKVVMSDLSEKSLKLTLDRKGPKYSGDDPSAIFGTCNGKPIPSSTTIDLTVTKAKGLSGEWIATRFTGTISYTTPPQLGCVRATATLSFTGNLLA
jgi:hypothetical protein